MYSPLPQISHCSKSQSCPRRGYNVVTDEELIEGLSFSAYHRISTVMFVPAQSGSAVEMVTVDPLDLQAAHDQDAGTLSMRHEMR